MAGVAVVGVAHVHCQMGETYAKKAKSGGTEERRGRKGDRGGEIREYHATKNPPLCVFLAPRNCTGHERMQQLAIGALIRALQSTRLGNAKRGFQGMSL
ncbi:hypothetical protein NDU88_002183 [Pleurodeles waltl]|uniref:Uncharacterized protein n=1 Tax=Pleurodeles waltl TaxID=8319 RepID=A0AAV7NHU6_PLEWA|nr:hypothetical protein NDU88_002183 [Pleurodeles waltl]